MLSSSLVAAVATIEGVAFVALACVLLGQAAWTRWRERRDAPRLERGRRALVALVAGAEAAENLAVLRSLPTRPRERLLVELARGLRGGARARIARVAADLGLTAAAERLCGSRFWWRRLRGARLLTLLGGGQASVPPLLHDADPFVRAQAAEWAADDPTEELAERLLPSLGDPVTLSRYTAQAALLRLGKVAVAPLARSLATQRGDGAAAALRVAIGLADPRFLAPALALCGDGQPLVRARAAALLGAIGGSQAAERLTDLLGDPAPDVRAAAIRALGAMGYWSASPRIARLLADPSWDVRRAAGLALRALGSPGGLYLRRALTDPDPFAADMARQVLAAPVAVEALA